MLNTKPRFGAIGRNPEFLIFCGWIIIKKERCRYISSRKREKNKNGSMISSYYCYPKTTHFKISGLGMANYHKFVFFSFSFSSLHSSFPFSQTSWNYIKLTFRFPFFSFSFSFFLRFSKFNEKIFQNEVLWIFVKTPMGGHGYVCIYDPQAGAFFSLFIFSILLHKKWCLIRESWRKL